MPFSAYNYNNINFRFHYNKKCNNSGLFLGSEQSQVPSPAKRKPDTFIPDTDDIIEPEVGDLLSGGKPRFMAESGLHHAAFLSNFSVTGG